MPSALEVPCPKCGKALKVPDRSLLGRKARCGKCQHKFVLTEPGSNVAPVDDVPVFEALEDSPPPVQFELVSPPPFRATPKDALPGLSPRWVSEPDDPVASSEAPFPAQPAPASNPLSGLRLSEPTDSVTPALFSTPLDDVSVGPPRITRRRRKSTWPIVISILLVGGLSAGGIVYSLGQKGSPAAIAKNAKGTGRSKTGTDVQRDDVDPVALTNGEETTSPTQGKPLSLAMIPMGARILVHLRPAELWEEGGAGDEFRACLGPLGKWLDQELAKLFVEPAQIDSLLCALIPVSREAFEPAFVVQTRRDVKRSDLIEKFGGDLVDTPKPHYRNERQVLWIKDSKTFALAPRDMADSLFESLTGDSLTSEGIQGLLARSDRDRHVTLLCELEDLRNGSETLVPLNVRNLLSGVLEFLGDDVETFAWSLHLGDSDKGRDLYSELLVRNRITRSPANLQRDLQQKLERLPAEMLDLVYRTDPAQLGEKKIIGRFPIMTKVVEQSVRYETAGRLVAMRAVLPERAAPNLALGTLLTWNQTTRPDFGKQPTTRPASADDNLPKTIAERLQKRINVEFRDDFLEVALNFIGDEVGVKFKLDGPGMRRVGTTQNERQTFVMENAPASAILDRMFTPRKLVLIVDEQKRTALVTSIDVAAEKNLQPFPLQAQPGN